MSTTSTEPTINSSGSTPALAQTNPESAAPTLDPSLAQQTTRSSSPRVSSTKAWLSPYRPLLHNSHIQTIAGNYWRRPVFTLSSIPEPVLVDAADGSRVLCHGHWQPEAVRSSRLTIVLVHGLEGSSDSNYVLGITLRAWEAGCNVIRMNMRNCGGTDTWTPTLYHSGLSGDVSAVVTHFAREYNLQSIAMVGYSMGGNLVLKLAGELAGHAPHWLLAAAAVCPAADLAASADALHQGANRLYERHFLRNLMRTFHRKAALFPERYFPAEIGPIHSIREFDQEITARYCGFSSASDYYFRSSGARVVDHISIPTLVIHALDDPFIRMTPETRQALSRNPAVELVETQYGGHCAFLTNQPSPRYTGVSSYDDYRYTGQEEGRHWAETTVARFLISLAAPLNPSRNGQCNGV